MTNFLRPFLRRFLIIRCPFLVDIRERNPDNDKIEARVLFNNVRFVISLYFYLKNLNDPSPHEIINN